MALAISGATRGDGGVIEHGLGNFKARVVTITLDTSYPTNGSALVPSDFGLTELHAVIVNPVNGWTFSYDFTNQKLLAYSTAATQVTNATNMSTSSTQALVIGR